MDRLSRSARNCMPSWSIAPPSRTERKTFLDDTSCRSSAELLPWATMCSKFLQKKIMEGLSVWVFARAPLSNNTPQVQGCGVVHQTRLIEEYDAAQHEADVEYLEVVAFLTFCAVGPSQVDHDGGRTLAVGEHAEPSAASDALGARDRHTILSHTPFFPLTSFHHARLCICMGSKQTYKWCVEIEKRNPTRFTATYHNISDNVRHRSNGHTALL